MTFIKKFYSEKENSIERKYIKKKVGYTLNKAFNMHKQNYKSVKILEFKGQSKF